MIDVGIDMQQYDCPFIDTTDDHDVTFSALHWRFDARREQLETRLAVEASDRETLGAGLRALRDHPNMCEYDLFSRRGDAAMIRTMIEQTDAMETIRRNDGYITGPFYIENGRERWDVGFDGETVADEALAELERGNDFTVESRRSLEPEALFDLLDNAGAASQLLSACRSLSTVESETLEAAVDAGYFEDPRRATLSTLAEEFDVSNTAVSKNLRRGERKVLQQVVEAHSELD